jgi:exoribonuclease-2
MKHALQLNEVVAFRKRSELALGILTELGSDKVLVFSEEGKEISVDLSKIVLGSGMKYECGMGDAEKKLALRALRRELEERRPAFDIETLWECVSGETHGLSFEDLAELHFGSASVDQREVFFFLWALDKDDVFFRRLPDCYQPRTREETEDIIRRKEAERKKLEERRAAVEWARSLIEGKEAGAVGEAPHSYIELLKNFVVFLDKYEKAPMARSFMSEVGIKNVDEAIGFLQKAGQWKEDDDPIFLRLGIRTSFPKKALDEALSIINTPPSFDGLLDLTSLPTYSIDDEETLDVDDAISITQSQDGIMLAVHIADVAGFVKKGSPLDEEAFSRGETIYLPEGHVHMFPVDLIRERLSLFEGLPKRALSLIAYFDSGFNLRSYTFANTKVLVDRNLSYEVAEEVLRSTRDGALLFEIAKFLRARRVESGGCIVDIPSLKVRVGKEGEIILKKNYMTSPSHIAVAECMILANALAGDFLKSHGVPAIYRYITEPAPEEIKSLDPNDPLYPVQAVKHLRPSRFGINPLPHEFLGVEAYVQITSPIRRYMDLVMQRQILRQIKGAPPLYTGQDLERIYHQVEIEIKDKKLVEKTRERFWLYKYLEGRVGECLIGYVSQSDDRSFSVYLPDYLIELPVSSQLNSSYGVGDRIDLKIESVEPIKRRISIVPQGRGL